VDPDGVSVWFTVFGRTSSDPEAPVGEHPRLITRPSTTVIKTSARRKKRQQAAKPSYTVTLDGVPIARRCSRSEAAMVACAVATALKHAGRDAFPDVAFDT